MKWMIALGQTIAESLCYQIAESVVLENSQKRSQHEGFHLTSHLLSKSTAEMTQLTLSLG
jgi:hypothetical protein